MTNQNIIEINNNNSIHKYKVWDTVNEDDMSSLFANIGSKDKEIFSSDSFIDFFNFINKLSLVWN